MAGISYGFSDLQSSAVRRDRWVVLVVIAIAVVIAAGLLVAWWAACQSRGLYPALDMPSWQDGGTWKVCCSS
jgi:hypothetical protein